MWFKEGQQTKSCGHVDGHWYFRMSLSISLILPFLLYTLNLFLLLSTPAYKSVVPFICTYRVEFTSVAILAYLIVSKCCSCCMETTFAELLNLYFSSFGGQTPFQKLWYLNALVFSLFTVFLKFFQIIKINNSETLQWDTFRWQWFYTSALMDTCLNQKHIWSTLMQKHPLRLINSACEFLVQVLIMGETKVLSSYWRKANDNYLPDISMIF